MKLQILIPHYKEKESVVKVLLDSIEMQKGIDLKNDISVIIVNDGDFSILSREFLNKYSFDIGYYRIKHSGISVVRNVLTDKATADYIMYCDADDCFSSPKSIRRIFDEIDEGEFDYLHCTFFQELYDASKRKYFRTKMENAMQFVHGKVYRLAFLRENNIRFDNDLTIHEDAYFNFVALSEAKVIKHIEEPLYVWKWRNDSVVRSEANFYTKSYHHLLLSEVRTFVELYRRNKMNVAIEKLIDIYCKNYLVTHSKEYRTQVSTENKAIADNLFKSFNVQFGAVLKGALQNENLIKKVFAEDCNVVGTRINISHRNGFFDWIKNI